MTFLEIINDVLRRLREDEVVSTNSTDYSKLIGGFVNDAALEVSDSWDWTHQFFLKTFGLVASTSTYDLGYQNLNIKSVINDTKNVRLKQTTFQDISDKNLLTDISGEPYLWAVTGWDENGKGIKVYPTPTSSGDTMAVLMKYPEVKKALDGTGDTGTFYTPSQPIVLMAYAKAVSERGEDGGIGYAEADEIARKSLADHISMDSATDHYSVTMWGVI